MIGRYSVVCQFFCPASKELPTLEACLTHRVAPAQYFRSSLGKHNSTKRYCIRRRANIIKTNDEHSIRPVTPKEILKITFKLRAKKAPDFDQKEAPKKLRVYLTYTFSMPFSEYVTFPSDGTKVIMVLKPGKPSDMPEFYRQIPPLPTLSKVFKKLYPVRLQEETSERSIVSDHQFGFWPRIIRRWIKSTE